VEDLMNHKSKTSKALKLAYTYVYATLRVRRWTLRIGSFWSAEMGHSFAATDTLQRKAKIFMNNRSQAVRLPKEFQFDTQEVFIRKEGSDVVLSPRPLDWSSYLAEGPFASQSFMEGIERPPGAGA
jgi:antitoxin VapB